MAHRTTHRRNLAAPEPNTSAIEPTKKKQPKQTLFKPHHHHHHHPHPPKDSDPQIHTISKHFSKLYTSHQNAAVSSRAPRLSPNPHFETSFLPKPISVSAIEDNPTSIVSHKGRKTMLEIEKEKLRASITKTDRPHDFKAEFLGGKTEKVKKSPGDESLCNEERDVKNPVVSLSKSHDIGLKVAHRGEGHELKRPSFSLSVTGDRRRSVCNSEAEVADFFSCNGVRVVSVDMPPFMQIHAVDCARKTRDSLEKFTSKTLALTLKKEFDGMYGPAWHCVVGSSFGSFVTHSVGGFMYFSMDPKIYVLLFKTSVQRAY